MLSKRGNRSVGEGDAGQKAKTTPDVGGKSVTEKSQATHSSKNPFEKSSSKQTQSFVRTNGLGGLVLSSSSGGVTFLVTTILAHGNIYLTDTKQYLSLEHTNI